MSVQHAFAALWVGLLLVTPLTAAPEDVPLRIVDKHETTQRSPITGEEEEIVRVTLVNTSDKTITAWRLSMLIATQAGHQATVYSQTDAYTSVAFPESTPADGGDVIAPGEELIANMPRNAESTAGPHGAIAFQVDAVIFEDATFAGIPRIADEIFAGRARRAADALEARELLLRERQRGVPLGDALDTVVAELTTADRPIRNEHLGRLSHERARLAPGLDDPAAWDRLLTYLDRRYDGTLEHLPPSWSPSEDLDGVPEQTAWTRGGAEEALLALDRDLNGKIDDGREIFGDRTPQLPSDAPNGFKALAVFDDRLNGGNEDGLIDAEDRIYTDLVLWVDRDHDGTSQPDELVPLADHVESIDLAYEQESSFDTYGNEFRFKSRVEPRGGEGAAVAWNVFFTPRDSQDTAGAP